MDDPTRRAIAYIAARLAGQRDSGSVYDHDARKHFHFSGQVEPGSVSIYDFSTRSHIGGSPSSLYHFGNRRHMTLTVSGQTFQGFDFASGSHFSGTISGSSLTVFDHGSRRHHHYSV